MFSHYEPWRKRICPLSWQHYIIVIGLEYNIFTGDGILIHRLHCRTQIMHYKSHIVYEDFDIYFFPTHPALGYFGLAPSWGVLIRSFQLPKYCSAAKAKVCLMYAQTKAAWDRVMKVNRWIPLFTSRHLLRQVFHARARGNLIGTTAVESTHTYFHAKVQRNEKSGSFSPIGR